ncbi:hypothetical protein BV20DRAFT_290663 [Pilatotrama ljubarskyi]|nr:hypothetical protein BV20DRAFT_290663 [Pilatotrama ljubarskyi]
MPCASTQADALGDSYATRSGRERGMLRAVLTNGLIEFTGDPRAAMFWTPELFRDKVFLTYGVKLVNWPLDIEFTNISKMVNPTGKVRALLDAWAAPACRMRWAPISQDELIAGTFDVRSACPGPHFQDPIPKGGRNDIGKRRARATDLEPEKYPCRHVRDGPKSARYISEEQDGEVSRSGALAGGGMERGTEADGEELEEMEEIEEESGSDFLQGLPPRKLHGELPEDPITSW